MFEIAKLFMPIVTRLFNRQTPKSILPLILGGILMYFGASEDLVKWGMEQNLTPVGILLMSALKLIVDHKIITSIITLILFSISGFYLWARDHRQYEINVLEHELKKLELKNKIKQYKELN
jgi:hypothetical protein